MLTFKNTFLIRNYNLLDDKLAIHNCSFNNRGRVDCSNRSMQGSNPNASYVVRLGLDQGQVTIHCDNQTTVHLSKHQSFHERPKHIDVKLQLLGI